MQASRLDLHSPILKPEEMEAIKAMSFRGWETKVGGGGGGWWRGGACMPCAPPHLAPPSLLTQCPPPPCPPSCKVIDITWPVADGPSGLSEALARVAEEASQVGGGAGRGWAGEARPRRA